LRNAAAAALDVAVLAGSGASGEPLGLTNTVGVGSVSGTSLAYDDVIEFQTDVGDLNAVINRGSLGWTTTPSVAAALKQRHRVASTDSPLWVGDVNAGLLDGKRAVSTLSCPADTLIYGDWSGITIFQWGEGLVIEVDPFSKFQQGVVGVRLVLPIDVLVARPSSFAIASSIT
jgi:HK97 family phage major capsid protein